MLLKKKVCLAILLFCILVIVIVTHTMQKGSILPVAVVASVWLHESSRPNQTQTLFSAASKPSAPVLTPKRACSCSSCVAERGASDWFDERFDHEQQPYLKSVDDSIDPLSLKWWLALQRSEKIRIENVLEKMFQVISTPSDDVAEPERCRRCAVVGNSGNLRGSKYGAAIDTHDFIIRMNKATTANFEADVGNRTTHHLMYPESAVDLDPGVHLVLLPFKLRDLQWVASALSTGEVKMTYMRVKDFIKADKNKVIVVNPAFFKYTHDHWNEQHGRYPSTGMLAIIFALHMCDQVSVFGYGADPLGNWHHYWENNQHAGAFRKTGVHHADFEMTVISKLHKVGKIKFHR
ncbi:ST3 beta-galactoside alpha-2,3-sialyltransferase 8 [Denticeps clupeoides]|uniref:CMP-N-acetylneuraminate-beta-galactosamide-alpha-2,3-sialyltransferase 2 n=1 Tax=Denticeps clupeoides TaxID=299321 RepID=A0AAY4DSR5_9TELE|nr:CMP-N-acetylneuraminate-beta-galactosamide-alpha-2,3-sialyltransferase 2-like [Denticeps clupeoides]